MNSDVETKERQTAGKGMPKADFVMGVILMLFSLLIVVESLRMPTFEKDWGGFYAAPGFVPLILGISLFGMSLFLCLRAVRKHGHKIGATRERLKGLVRAKPAQRWCLTVCYAFGYFFVLGHIHFAVATFLALFAFMATFSRQKIHYLAVISALVSAAVYLVFSRLFLVPLP
jgi:hypothetical protein